LIVSSNSSQNPADLGSPMPAGDSQQLFEIEGEGKSAKISFFLQVSRSQIQI
jgi:hypothetical protein